MNEKALQALIAQPVAAVPNSRIRTQLCYHLIN